MTWIYLFRKYAVWLSINLYVLLTTMWLSFTAMNLYIKYGARARTTLHEKLIQTNGYIWLPLAAAACWFIFREDLATLLSLLSWVGFVGFLASCSLLLMKTRKA